MFKDSGNGETQYCPMCYDWAEKYNKLEAENLKIKQVNKDWQSTVLKLRVEIAEQTAIIAKIYIACEELRCKGSDIFDDVLKICEEIRK